MYFFAAWKDGKLETEQWVDTIKEVTVKAQRYEDDGYKVTLDWMNDDNRLVQCTELRIN